MSNPFELRFKVLEMARDLCYTDYSAQENAYFSLVNSVDEAIRSGHVSDAETLMRKIDNLKPTSPSPDTIKDKAAELYEFVERKAGR